MLSVYSNQQNLINSTNTTNVARIQPVDITLMTADPLKITFAESYRPNLELHVYTPDGIYLTGNYDTKFTIENNDTTFATDIEKHLSVDLEASLNALGINRGQYKVVYNVFNNIIGSYDGSKLWIKEISPSRTELRVQLFDNNNTSLKHQYSKLYAAWHDSISADTYNTYLLNFGNNETYQISNILFDTGVTGGPELILKLYSALPATYTEKTQLWISEDIINPVFDTVSIVPTYIPEVSYTLAGPNFNLSEYEKSSIATDYKSWNDLLGASLTTSQQLIDSQFPSGSLSGIKLNLNYRLFDNFVHFSSATERVENFYYKLQLIEHYSDQIQTVAGIIGDDIVQTNLADLYSKRNAVVSGFDDFEKYLFFESTGSTLYSNYDFTGSINPWPKVTATTLTWSEAFALWAVETATWISGPLTSTDPYGYFGIQASTVSTVGLEYYNNLLELARIYDSNNIHKLQNAVPTYLLDSENSNGGNELSLFVHMLGQHFDIIWTYIKSLTSISTREEHPKDGMPSDLLYHVASSLGFQLLNGKSSSDLWNYSLGLNTDGTAITSNANGVLSLPDGENTKEIWRRIVNNLPYILKSKGTSRSVKALLSCFGIPSTILTIKEYGGPSTYTDNNHYPQYVKDVFHYAWSSSTGSLKLSANTYTSPNTDITSSVNAGTLEFRFKTDINQSYAVGAPYNIFYVTGSMGTGSLSFTNDNNRTGTISVNFNESTGSVSNLYLLDGAWHTVVIERYNNTGSLKVAKSLYGKDVYVQSSSIGPVMANTLINWDEDIYFATGSNKFIGHFHEIRLWSGSLNDETIFEHAASPYTYTYNVDRDTLFAGQEADKPYDHLIQRFTLSSDVIYSGSFYQKSVHPNQSVNNTGSIYFIDVDTSGSIQFDGIEETYYSPSPSLGGSSLYTNKVRIDSSSLDLSKRLNTKTRVEKSSLDKYSIDSNRLGIYFSPQNAINEDIFNQLGYFEIDDYIGNPADVYNDKYTNLATFSKEYWKKSTSKNDFESYFRALQHYDFTLFEYIKRILPQRINLISGLVIEPNVLERSKVKMVSRPTLEDLYKTAEITNTDTNPDIIGSYVTYEGIIDSDIPNVNKTGFKWMQHRYIGKYKITESGSYTPIQTIIVDSRQSQHLLTSVYFYSSAISASMQLPVSSSFIPANINNNHGIGYDNSRYNGSKLIGSSINVDSVNTIDGGPVVKITRVNPNQLVYAANQITTTAAATTGQRAQSLPAS